MTAITASDASARAHARFYPCMRRDGGDLPKPYWLLLSERPCGLRDWFWSYEGAGTSLHRKIAVTVGSRHPRRVGRRDGRRKGARAGSYDVFLRNALPLA